MKHNLGIIRFTSILLASLLGAMRLEASLAPKAGQFLLGLGKRAVLNSPNPVTFGEPIKFASFSYPGKLTDDQASIAKNFLTQQPEKTFYSSKAGLRVKSPINGVYSKNGLKVALGHKPGYLKGINKDGNVFYTAVTKPTGKTLPQMIQELLNAKAEIPKQQLALTIPAKQPLIQIEPAQPNLTALFLEWTKSRKTLYIPSPMSSLIETSIRQPDTSSTSLIEQHQNPIALPSNVQPTKLENNNGGALVETLPEQTVTESYKINERTVHPVPVDSIKFDPTTGKVVIKTSKKTYCISEKQYKKIKAIIENMEKNPYLDRSKELFIPLNKRNGIVVDLAAGTLSISTGPVKNYEIDYAKKNNPAKHDQKALALTHENQYSIEVPKTDVITKPTVKRTQADCPLITEKGRPEYIDLNSSEFEVISTKPDTSLTTIRRATELVVKEPTGSLHKLEPQGESTGSPEDPNIRRRPSPSDVPTSPEQLFNPIKKITAPRFKPKVTAKKMIRFPSSPFDGILGKPDLSSDQGFKVKGPEFKRIDFTTQKFHIGAPTSPSTSSGNDTHSEHEFSVGAPFVPGLFAVSQLHNDEEDLSDNPPLKEETTEYNFDGIIVPPRYPKAELDKPIKDYYIDKPGKKDDTDKGTDKPVVKSTDCPRRPDPMPIQDPEPDPIPREPTPDPLPAPASPPGVIPPGPMPELHLTDALITTPKSFTKPQDLDPIAPPIKKRRPGTVLNLHPELEDTPSTTKDNNLLNNNKNSESQTPSNNKENDAKKGADETTPVAPEQLAEKIKEPIQGEPVHNAPSFPASSAPFPSGSLAPTPSQKTSAAPASKTASSPAANTAATPYQPSHANYAPHIPTPIQPEKFKDSAPPIVLTSDKHSPGTRVHEHADPAEFQRYPRVSTGSRQATHDTGHTSHHMEKPAELSTITFPKPSASQSATTTSTNPVQSSTPRDSAWEFVVKTVLYVMAMGNIALGSISTRWLKGILRLLSLSPA